MASVRFLTIGSGAFEVHTHRGGHSWDEGQVIRVKRGHWQFVLADGDIFGHWRSEEKAKRAICDYVESWGE